MSNWTNISTSRVFLKIHKINQVSEDFIQQSNAFFWFDTRVHTHYYWLMTISFQKLIQKNILNLIELFIKYRSYVLDRLNAN